VSAGSHERNQPWAYVSREQFLRWVSENGYTTARLGLKLGVAAVTARTWINGSRLPGARSQKKIRKLIQKVNPHWDLTPDRTEPVPGKVPRPRAAPSKSPNKPLDSVSRAAADVAVAYLLSPRSAVMSSEDLIPFLTAIRKALS